MELAVLIELDWDLASVATAHFLEAVLALTGGGTFPHDDVGDRQWTTACAAQLRKLAPDLRLGMDRRRTTYCLYDESRSEGRRLAAHGTVTDTQQTRDGRRHYHAQSVESAGRHGTLAVRRGRDIHKLDDARGYSEVRGLEAGRGSGVDRNIRFRVGCA